MRAHAYVHVCVCDGLSTHACVNNMCINLTCLCIFCFRGICVCACVCACVHVCIETQIALVSHTAAADYDIDFEETHRDWCTHNSSPTMRCDWYTHIHATTYACATRFMYIQNTLCVCTCVHFSRGFPERGLFVQPIASGVTCNLNLESQSPWSLFNGTW